MKGSLVEQETELPSEGPTSVLLPLKPYYVPSYTHRVGSKEACAKLFLAIDLCKKTDQDDQGHL